ncbi:MAG TPA: carbohydrate ABC transporter permease [Chloroflexi bacterium]|nr:carbohydrate ABC transporter permease [Chloroflexota bacterium]HHW85040.1 carbohydrate ABC transporter permease [Chloroflexota bacterium]
MSRKLGEQAVAALRRGAPASKLYSFAHVVIRPGHTAAHLWHGAALLVAVIFLLPLVWMTMASLQPIGLPPARAWTGFPAGVAWSNYAEIFRVIPLAQQLGNSFLVSTVGAGVTLLTASWAGFAMVQMSPRVQHWLVGLALLLLLIPANAVWLPRYVLFARLGLIDTYTALLAASLMGTKSLFVLMYYWSFRRVTVELFESAWLDGASVWTGWRRLAMPLAAPTTLAVLVLSFSHYWSDFVDPLLFLKTAARFTVAVGLRSLQQMDVTRWSLLLAAVVVMIAPVMLLYIGLQMWLRDEPDFARRVLRRLFD